MNLKSKLDEIEQRLMPDKDQPIVIIMSREVFNPETGEDELVLEEKITFHSDGSKPTVETLLDKTKNS